MMEVGKKKSKGQQNIMLKANFEVTSKIEAFYTGGKVQFSSDCSSLFCTCGDAVKVVNVDDGKIEATIKEDDDELTCFVLSPDDKYLFTAKRSLLLRMWNWKDNKLVRKFKAIHIGPIVTMAFDTSSTLLATGSSDRTIKVWDVIKQYCTHNFKGSDGVVSLLQFHPDPDKLQLFSSSTDCKIRIWDLNLSKCISILDGHYSAVTSLCFTHDNMYMISGGRDKVIIFWDLSNRSLMKTIPTFEGVEGVLTVPECVSCPGSGDDDDTHFISVGEKGNFRVWQFSTGKCIFERASDSYLARISESDDAKESHPSTMVTQFIPCETLGCVACVTHDHNVVLYDFCSLERQKQFVGYYDEILDVRMMDGKNRCLAIATNSSDLKVLEIESSDCHVLLGHTDTILSLDVSFDGKLIATCSKDNSIRVWKVVHSEDEGVSFQWVAFGVGHTSAVGTIIFPRLSKKFLITGSEDLTVKYWVLPPKFKDEAVQLSVKWTEKAHDKDINSTAISPNDKLLATGSQDKTAKIWAVASGKLLGILRGHRRGVWCVAFSPIDQCLATASADTTIKIWAMADFTCVKTLEGHSNSVLRVQFVTRGMQLLSSGSDGLIKLWNVRMNECTQTFDEHEDKIWALAMSAKEDIMVTGGADSCLIFWKDVTEKDIEDKREEKEQAMLKEQELSNLLQLRQFLKAISLAITLQKPFTVLTIFKDILEEADGNTLLTDALQGLENDQINSLLKFMCDWNTNAKHAFVTQTVLSIIVKCKRPETLLEYPNIKETVESLLPYTERHFQRLNRMVQQSAFVEYTWQAMKLLKADISEGADRNQQTSIHDGQDQIVAERSKLKDSESSDEVDLDVEMVQTSNNVDCEPVSTKRTKLETC